MVTIVFCDLVDSTELSEQLDAEDYREILKSYQAECAKLLEFYTGFIAQYLGDGILCYFGYPLAFGDDATRAVNAGLEIVTQVPEQLKQRFAQTTSHELAVRVGIHTGTVVTGEVGGGATREHLALGSAPNVAARLQGLAGNNEVVISARTRKLVSQHFLFADLGRKQLKGIQEELRVFKITQRLVAGDEEPTNEHKLHVVGRNRELVELLDSWASARAGHGQLVYISGEPGIGKSTLLTAFDRNCELQKRRVMRMQGSPYHGGSAFYPLINMLSGLVAGDRQMADANKSQAFKRMIEDQHPALRREVHIMLELMSLPVPETPSSSDLSPAEMRARFKQACTNLLSEMTQVAPVQLIVEDAHYLDPSTIEWLNDLTTSSHARALLIVITSRPEGDSDWKRTASDLPATIINLKSLGDSDSERIILNLTAGKTLPRSLKTHLIKQTGGNPLFLKQLLQSLLESGLVTEKPAAYELSGPIDRASIPSTLQASLLARLDSFGEARKLAGLAATAGQTFSLSVLRKASSLTPEEFDQYWASLLNAEVICVLNQNNEDVFTFTHGLIRDAAYEALLRRTRRYYHEKFAELLLEHQAQQNPNEQGAEILAFHFSEAGLPERAIPLWKQAGDEALFRSAHIEARDHYGKALRLLEEEAGVLPSKRGFITRDDVQNLSQIAHLELDIRLGNAVSLFATVGPAATDSIKSYEAARKLCTLLDDKEKLTPVLIGLWIANLCQVNLSAAADLAAQCLALAGELGDVTAELYALIALGNTTYTMGNFAIADKHLERAERLLDTVDEEAFRLRYSLEPRVQIRMFQTHIKWFMGRGLEAEETALKLEDLVGSLGNPLNKVIYLYAATIHQQHRRDVDRVHIFADQTIELASSENAMMFLGTGLMYKGWVQGMRGQHEAGLRLIESGFYDHLKPAAGDVAHSIFCLLSGEVNLLAGKIDAGLEIIEQGIAFAERHQDLAYAADLHRILGGLQMAAGDITQSQAAFVKAIDIAVKQGAVIFELRARLALALSGSEPSEREANRQRMAELSELIEGGMTDAERASIASYLGHSDTPLH